MFRRYKYSFSYTKEDGPHFFQTQVLIITTTVVDTLSCTFTLYPFFFKITKMKNMIKRNDIIEASVMQGWILVKWMTNL